jgi:hypothetical protein
MGGKKANRPLLFINSVCLVVGGLVLGHANCPGLFSILRPKILFY